MKAVLPLRVIAVILLAPFLVSPSFADIAVANDPSRIGVGARILGMGKGYVGLADDLGGIFINPAALSRVDRVQATSMQGKFINEYDYLNLGVAAPTQFGTFGIGYVGSSIGFTGPAATTEVVDGIRIIPSTTEGVRYGFSNSLILLSWGRELRGLGGWKIFDDLSAGATLKLFSVGMTGPGIVGGDASGKEVDLGVNFRPDAPVSAGVVLHDALPFDWGGKLEWKNGNEETYSSCLKVGLSLKLLGDKGFREFHGHDLKLNIDRDFFPTRSESPALWHIGLEWSPLDLIALRAGIDQDVIGREEGLSLTTADNFTAGVGLFFNEYRFDYAYHQYNQLSANDTHYFSLSWGFGKKKEAPPAEKKPSFSITPPDKSILYTDRLTIEGAVLNLKIKQVLVNSLEVTLEENRFSIPLGLEMGKNPFLVEGLDRGRLIDAEKIRILRLKKFKDIPSDYWAVIPISFLAMEGVISGYPDGSFKPEGDITRAEMCTLLMRTKGIGDFKVSGKPYRDVSATHWAANYIGAAARQGIVRGYPDGTFRPNNPITRADGVTIVARFAGLPESRVIEVPFSDVAGRHWAIKEISAAKEAGLLKYLKDAPFSPNQKLTRAEVAEILSRTVFFRQKLDDIMDWEAGY